MHPGILACPASAPLRTLAKVMSTHGVHCVAVIGVGDAHHEAPVLGVVSDLDLVRSALSTSFDTPAAQLALDPVITVEASAPLSEAGETMSTNGVQHLVVVAPGSARPIGVLSALDVAATIGWGGD
jgi:CBS domain-containing protein